MSAELDLGLLKTYRVDQNVGRINIGARMTIMKLNNGDLFVHSPVRLSSQIRQDIEDFGRVKIVVAPNDFHHLFVKDFMANYLDAEFIGSPGLRGKRPDLSFSRYFNDGYNPSWKSEIDFVVYRGSKNFHEVVFFHVETSTLILTDLTMNLRGEYGLVSSLVLKFLGVHNQMASSRLIRRATKNRVSARDTVRRILQWPFQRIIMAHGEVIESDARMHLRQALHWLS